MGNVRAVSAGYSHSLFLTNDYVAYSAGDNEFGQLGITEYGLSRSSPMEVLREVAAISAGECHSLFVRTDGAVWGAGCNQFGQLGDSTTLMRPSPSLSTIDGVTLVYGGASKSLFIKADETVWAAGQADDSYGHLPGPDWPRSTPVQVAANFSALETGLNVVLGNTVFATDNRFPPDDPLYYTELPQLPGLGWNNWNYR
jgi:alpha-tubulin suppressor-like RCC1 family protein